jgi:hypothetical protein
MEFYMRIRTILRRSNLAIAFAFATPLLLTGCSGMPSTSSSGTTANPFAAVNVAGNWQISSSSTAAANLPAISGALAGTGAAITGVLHPLGLSGCISAATVFTVNGSATSTGAVKLTSSSFAGGSVLTVNGTLATDGRSLTNATYTVTGGSCSFATAATATAQAYAGINGTYTGTLTDASGQGGAITATITQSTTPDANGNFSVTGAASFPNNPCIASPSSSSTSQVTGGTFSFTYTDSASGNQVLTSGNFSTDATTLTVTNYTLTGSGYCQDTGTGVLTHQ